MRAVAMALVTGAAVLTVLVLVLFHSSGRSAMVHPFTAGNVHGRFLVPAAGRAVDTQRPNHVIGSGNPGGCTSDAVVRAVAEGGVITFNCGPNPVTIVMTQTARVPSTLRNVVIDGGGLVTLSGGNIRRILFSDTCQIAHWTGSCTDSEYPRIVVQNITFEDGYSGTPQATCTADVPECGFGGVTGGGAIYVEGGQFAAVNSRFIDNRCYPVGPDLGGGAIRALLQYQDRPVYIVHDTFAGGRCSNGGALSSISVQWDVLDSLFTENAAVGTGANPAVAGTPGGGSGGAIYLDGADFDALIAGSVFVDNYAREGGGAVFDVVDTGWGSVIFNESELDNNVSGKFQTSPGVFLHVDGNNEVAQQINPITG